MSETGSESTGEPVGPGDAGASPRISVITPTYNRAEELRLTLASLCEQTLPVDEYEVIVADDGSSDHTRSVVDSFAGRLRLKYHFQEDLGFRAAEARNAGVRLAEAPILVFLDCAALAGPNLLAAYLRAHTPLASPGQAFTGYVHAYPPRASDDPEYTPLPGLAEAVATMTAQQVADRYRDEPAFRDARHGEFEKVDFDLRNRSFPEELFWTMNCSVPTADFWAVGGFDEGFRGWGLEDLELAYRLRRNGTVIQLSREAWAIETPHERDAAANFEALQRNVQYFLDKHQFAEPLLEIGWMMLQSGEGELATLETLNRRVMDWSRKCAGVSAATELTRALEQIAPDARVAVFGAGATVPAIGRSCVLADFDRQVVDRLQTIDGGGHQDVRHNLGIRTALPDNAVDAVVITSRLSGLWDDFGPAIMAEAHRIGTRVYHPGF